MNNSEEQRLDLLASNMLEVDEATGRHLKEAGVWGKTLAFITIAIVALAMVFFAFYGRLFSFATNGAEMAGAAVGILLLLGVMTLFILNLFRFSKGIQEGVDNQDIEAFEKGLSGLKNYFIFIAIASALITLSTLFKLLN